MKGIYALTCFSVMVSFMGSFETVNATCFAGTSDLGRRASIAETLMDHLVRRGCGCCYLCDSYSPNAACDCCPDCSRIPNLKTNDKRFYGKMSSSSSSSSSSKPKKKSSSNRGPASTCTCCMYCSSHEANDHCDCCPDCPAGMKSGKK